ncbi:MAG: LTA synthase family protein [Parahaliea sp.]
MEKAKKPISGHIKYFSIGPDSLVFGWLLILSFLVYKKLQFVDTVTGKFAGCSNCFELATLEQDASYLSAVVIIFTLSAWLGLYYLKVALRLLAMTLTLVYIADIYVMLNFFNRLHFEDITRYFNIKSFLSATNNQGFLFCSFALFLFISLLIVFDRRSYRNKNKAGLLILSIALIIFSLLPNTQTHIDNFLLKNVLAANQSNGEYTPYSSKFSEKIINQYGEQELFICHKNQKPRQANIILLIVESLSPYQSQWISGLNNWTPEFDKIIKEGRYYRNFFGNHYNSELARTALFTGEIPISPVKNPRQGLRIINWFSKTPRTLPDTLNKNGYHSIVMSGADLSINHFDGFMKKAGFSEINDSRDPYYKGQPRFSFNSVSDDILYENFLIKKNDWPSPYFASILTVSSHEPFTDPKTGKKGVDKVIQYADQAMGKFYKKLKESGFFNNGILIITSDHRSMTPIYKKEQKLLGLTAPAKLPFLVVGKGFEGESNVFSQQADLLQSIQSYISPEYCLSKGRGQILNTPPVPTECAYHVQGGFRDRISVFCNEGHHMGVVKLAGDNTKVIDGHVPEKAIENIHLWRIREAKRQRQ